MTEPRTSRKKLTDVVPLAIPFVLFIDPCGRCNMRCRFCPTNNTDYLAQIRHTTMSLKLFNKIVIDLQKFNEPIQVINLYGFGEPLLNSNIVEMIKLLKQTGVCKKVRLTTNGVLLNQDLSERLVESGLDLLRVSVNGVRDTDYVNICGVPVLASHVYNNVKTIYEKSRNTQTKISTKYITASNTAKEDINIFYNMYVKVSDYCFFEDEEEHWSGFKAVEPGKQLSKREYTGRSGICSYTFTHMTVFSNGKVGICCNDWKMETAIGDVNIESLYDIWNSERIRLFQLNMLSGIRNNMASCRECKVISPDYIDNNDAKMIANKIIQGATK